MIDAYTIGITLALNDGVSDGITAIRRDLALLDASMNVSATRLQMLRKLASEIVFPADYGRSAGQITASPQRPDSSAEKTAPPAADAAPMVQAPSYPLPTAQMPAASTMAPIVAPDPPEFLAPVVESSMTPSRRAPAVPDASLPALAPRSSPTVPTAALAPRPSAAVPAPAPAPTLSLPVAVSAFSTGRDQAAPIAPLPAPAAATPTPHTTNRSVAFNRSGSTALVLGQEPPPVRAAAPADLPASPLRRDALAPASPPPVRSMAAASSAAMSSFAPSVPPIVMKQAAQDTARPSSAPVAISPPPLPAVSTPTSNIAQAAAPAPASASSDRATTVYAEIHLDGSALGRWVTRHLEKQVLRPPAGATDFDPRMTPSWPGAPTGN